MIDYDTPHHHHNSFPKKKYRLINEESWKYDVIVRMHL